MTREQEHPNWVEARAYCTLQGTFEQLVDAIKQDVDCFKQLPANKRLGACITVQPQLQDDAVLFVRLADRGSLNSM